MLLECNSIKKTFSTRFSALAEAFNSLQISFSNQILGEEEALEQICHLIDEVKQKKGAIYAIGNGGSGATLSHFCLELVKNAQISAGLLADSHLISAIANDCGVEEIFRVPIATRVKKNDLIVAVSASGNSPNILTSLDCAHELGAVSLTLSGFSASNSLRQKGTINIWVDSCDASLVEACHFFILHTIIDHLLLRAGFDV